MGPGANDGGFMAQKVGFRGWFVSVTRAAKADFFDVPPSVTSLSCGCVRELKDPNTFQIAWRGGAAPGWIHCKVGCMKQLDVPATPVPKPKHVKSSSLVSRRVMGCWGGLS